MNGLEKITQRILSDAQTELSALEQRTDEEILAIRSGYLAQVDRERAEILARGEKAAQERRERLASAAKMEARKRLLRVKQEVMGEAFSLAVRKLCDLPQEEKIAFLIRLAGKAAPDGRGALLFSAADREAIGNAVTDGANAAYGAHFTLGEETRRIPGGFILAQGDVEVNCSFETLVRLQRDELEGEVAAILFS